MVPGDGLKIGPRANFSSDYSRVEGGEIQTIYVSGDPHGWIKKMEIPFPEEIETSVDRYCTIAREANDIESGIRPGRSQELRDAWHQQSLICRLGLLKIDRDPFGSPFLEAKELAKDVESGKLASFHGKTDAKLLRLNGRYWTARLDGFAAADSSEEGILAVQCDAHRAAVIGLEQALIEPKLVIYFLSEGKQSGRRGSKENGCYQDLVAVMSQTIEKKVRLLVVIDQGLADEQNVLTDFLIAAKTHTGVPTVMVAAEAIEPMIMCLGLKVTIESEHLVKPFKPKGGIFQSWKPPAPKALFRDGPTLVGQTDAEKSQSAEVSKAGRISMSQRVPRSTTDWFARLMSRSLPLEDWMTAVQDSRDPGVDYSQRHSLSLARTAGQRRAG